MFYVGTRRYTYKPPSFENVRLELVEDSFHNSYVPNFIEVFRATRERDGKYI